jgi:hypothetical protein
MFALAILFVSGSLYAADPSDLTSDIGFIPDLSADADMVLAPTSRESFVFSFGGWLTPVVVYQSTGSGDITSSMNSLKLWGNLSLGGNSFIYVRGKDLFTRIIAFKGMNGKKTRNSYDLDAAYVEIATDNRSIAFDAGRKYYILGTGIALNGRGDGVGVSFVNRIVDLNVFGLYTGLLKKDDNPYGISSRDTNDGAKRILSALTLSRDIGNQNLYAFGLVQVDLAKETAASKIRYQSQYFGLGMKGVPADGLEYAVEGIYETGKSYISGTAKTGTISANAANAEVNYYMDASIKPVFSVQYAFASGDADRTSSSDASGNVSGSDNGFISFGDFNGGLALRPQLSNIHLIRAGVSIMPFASSSSNRIKRMSFGAKYSYYLKDKADGLVNGNEGSRNSKQIGQGVDLSYKWKVYTDFSVFAQYGLFLPGSAYPSSEKNRQTAIGGFLIEF